MSLEETPEVLEFPDQVGDTRLVQIRIKESDGSLRGEVVPHVHMFKAGHYMGEDESLDPEDEVDIVARQARALAQQENDATDAPKLHGFVLEGVSPYGTGTDAQMKALCIAAYSGIPTVLVGRSDPGGLVPCVPGEPLISGSNLDTNKARLLLMACLLKFGRLPKARGQRNPTSEERRAVQAKVERYQEIFDTH